MQKIDLFIAGAQKAGTTSMKNYLGEHPQITTHVAQEFSFFYDDQEFNRGLEYAFSHYFYKQSISNNKIVCKHAHFYTSEKAIIRLSQHNPDCKLIIILRNPVERAYSSYLMEKLYSRVHFEFDEIVYALDGSNRLILEPWQQEAIISFGFYSNCFLKRSFDFHNNTLDSRTFP